MKFIDYAPPGTPDSLRVAECASPLPGSGEILIEVHYAGVNRPDVMQRMGRYPPPPGASPILGLEVAGHVAALGAGVNQWRVGDLVCALVPGGGYAQFCVAPADHALALPSGLSLAQAAGLPENWFTVWANLIGIAALGAGEWVLIHGGSSGIGLAAIQLARHVGAHAIVTVGSDEKARFCREFGASEAINYRSEDFVARTQAITAGRGVDVVLDMVGGDYFSRNLDALKMDGRIVFIASLGGGEATLPIGRLMQKRGVVTGSTLRPRNPDEKARLAAAVEDLVWPWIEAGKVRPQVDSTFPLAQAARAHAHLEADDHVGKIVLVTDSL
jgi:NADPH:quinone reductase